MIVENKMITVKDALIELMILGINLQVKVTNLFETPSKPKEPLE